MKIQFEWEDFYEPDGNWSMLFVRVGNGEWHGAQSKYGTEDKEEITKIIRLNQLVNLVVIGCIPAIILALIVILNYGK